MKMKKILSLLISLAMVMSFAIVPASAEESDAVELVLAGEGTEQSPYLITGLDDLLLFRDQVNAGEFAGKYIYVKLMNDIDLEQMDWVPIGTSSKVFQGNFDGNEKTISNLWLLSSQDYSGFFGQVGNNPERPAVVKNLTFDGVEGYSLGSCSGVVAGETFTAKMYNVAVKNAIVNSNGNYIGGLVGHGYTAFENCSFEGQLTGQAWQAGGLFGSGQCNATDCYVNGTISGNTWIGGICGNAQESSSAIGCYVGGAIKALSVAYDISAAGIFAAPYATSQKIQNNYCDATVTCGDETVVAPIIGGYNEELTEATDFSKLSGNSWNRDIFDVETITIMEIASATGFTSSADRNNNLVMLESDLAYIDAESVEDVTIMSFSDVTKEQVADVLENKNKKGISLTVYTDGVEGITLSGEDLSSILEQIYSWIDMGAVFGNPDGVISFVIDIYEDTTDANTAVIKYPATINGNGHTISYTGTDRAIEIPNETGDAAIAINNLTVNCSAGYCQRGINYNATGSLALDNVTVKGTAVTYALNLPGKANNCTVTINNSDISGCIALNVWGSDSTITATNTKFTSVDNAEHENYSAVKLNNDGITSAEGSVIEIVGGSISANDDSNAATNMTETGKFIISDTTTVDGDIVDMAAVVIYEGATDFYACTTLQNAMDQAANDPRATVKLIRDITLSESVMVEGAVVMDLNGKTIAGADSETAKSFNLFVNKGNFTIKDSVGNGKITLEATTDRGWSCSSSIISNSAGTLVIENGTLEHLGGTDMAYVIDNNSTLGETVTTVNGGTLVSPYRAIRLFQNSTADNIVNVTGGTISAKAGIWLQQPSSGNKVQKGTLNVTGGTFDCYSNAVVIDIQGAASSSVNISDGTFKNENANANLLLIWPFSDMNAVSGAVASMNITGGKFTCAGEGKLIGILDGADANGDVVISGGTYSEDVSAYCAEGYVCEANQDGTYGIVEAEAEAPTEIYTVEDLINFRNAVNNGNTYAGVTVTVKADIDLANEAWIPIGTSESRFAGIFDGGNFTISNLNVSGVEAGAGLFGWVNGGKVNNVKIKNADVSGISHIGAVVGNFHTGTMDNCHVSGTVKVVGNYEVGGLVGYGYVSISESSVTGSGIDSSCVVATYVGSDVEGDSVGGIIGAKKESGYITDCSVSGVSIAGTRKVGGIVGSAFQANTITGCSVENVAIATNAPQDYATSKASTMGIGGIAGLYNVSGSTVGNTANCSVKNVTFNVPEGITASVGYITGGIRIGSAPADPAEAMTYSNNTATGCTSNVTANEWQLEKAEEPAIMQKMLVVYNMEVKERDDGKYYPIHVYSGIDSLKYNEVGYKIVVTDMDKNVSKEKTEDTNVVYRNMKVTQTDGTVKNYGAKEALGGTYMFGHEMLFTKGTWTNANTKISVTPYAKKLDGNYVWGKEVVLTDAAVKAKDKNSALFREEKN